MNSMKELLENVKERSRLFNEPPPPKPTADSLAAEVDSVMEEMRVTAQNLRRLEHRLILVREKLNGLQTIQRP